MGWVKRKKNKWKQRLYDSSLKKALAVYIVLGTAGTFLTILLSETIFQSVDSSIRGSYLSEPGVYSREYYYISMENVSSGDRTILELLDFLESWSPVFCIVAGVALTSILFYRNKMREPLQILTDCAGRIGENNLDFHCEYPSGDEMGKLCRSFETMRRNLMENQRKMWDMMEEQKRLNRAFAHDLRTPLTVLHGYIDFLVKYYPEGNISEEKLLDTLKIMDKQVVRLKRFGDTMKSVGTLEERGIEKKPVTGLEFLRVIKEITGGLDGTGGIHIWMENRIGPGKELWLDEGIVCEVTENILSNSLRYAEEWIQVVLDEVGGFLEIYIKDDGPGFDGEGLKMAAKPYYRDKNSGHEDKEGEHFGIGLYICRVLCEKHGGSLALSNSVGGGAIICAAFCIQPPDIEKK